MQNRASAGQSKAITFLFFFCTAQTAKEQEKYTTSIDIVRPVCYNFQRAQPLSTNTFDDGDISMNAKLLLGIQTVLISLPVRLIPYTIQAQSHVLH